MPVLDVVEAELGVDRHLDLDEILDFVLEDQADRDVAGLEVQIDDGEDAGRLVCRLAGRRPRLEDLGLDEDQDARTGQLEDEHPLQVEDERAFHRAEHDADAEAPSIRARDPRPPAVDGDEMRFALGLVVEPVEG